MTRSCLLVALVGQQMAKVHNPHNLSRKLLSDVLAKNTNEYATNSYAFIFSQLLGLQVEANPFN